MLNIKIDIEQSKENYQAVVQALADFDIVSASWEGNQDGNHTVTVSGTTDPHDMGKNLSAIVDKLEGRSRGL
jgi:hypothetical protein